MRTQKTPYQTTVGDFVLAALAAARRGGADPGAALGLVARYLEVRLERAGRRDLIRGLAAAGGLSAARSRRTARPSILAA